MHANKIYFLFRLFMTFGFLFSSNNLIEKMAQSVYKYAVIEFTDEETVEVASTRWLTEDKRSCYWPNSFGKKLTKLLVNHFDPLKDSDKSIVWQLYDCRVFGTYGKNIFNLVNYLITITIFKNYFLKHFLWFNCFRYHRNSQR